MNKAEKPQYYGTLARLVIDRIQAEGADINGRVGEHGDTVLFCCCQKLKQSFLKMDRINYIHYSVEIMRAKSKEFCVSLINKGADPFLAVGDQTAIDVLMSGLRTAEEAHKKFLLDLAQNMREERERFLQNGTTPNELVQRTHIGHGRVHDPQESALLTLPTPRISRKIRRTNWLG